jgi:hypothetical protein
MIKLEKKIEETIEDYMSVDFDETESIEERSPFSLIMDLSDVKPGEIEIEDEIKMGYLWKKYSKKSK